jgi:hypothetical protein
MAAFKKEMRSEEGKNESPSAGGRPETVSTADKLEADIIYPTRLRLTMIMISLFISNFLVSLDRTIIAPTM